MKRKPRFEYNRWEFKKVKCPYCNSQVCKNWVKRHIQKKHPNIVQSTLNSTG